jgi:peptide/nickel transport system substrate-binding protein
MSKDDRDFGRRDFLKATTAGGVVGMTALAGCTGGDGGDGGE